MKRIPRLFPPLSVLTLSLLSSVTQAQWFRTSYNLPSPTVVYDVAYTQTNNSGSPAPFWFSTSLNTYQSVQGSSTTSPPWDSPFATLSYQKLSHPYNHGGEVPAYQTYECRMRYYQQIGNEAFIQVDEPFGAAFRNRDWDDFIGYQDWFSG